MRIALAMILLAIVISLNAAGHKEASSVAAESGDVKVELEVRPQQVVVHRLVEFHLLATKKNEPLQGANIKFEVKTTASGTTEEKVVDEFVAYETSPGVYHGEYAFPEVHSYIVEGHVDFEGGDVHVQKSIDAEQKGPSLAFWAFMILALGVALVMGYKGAEIK